MKALFDKIYPRPDRDYVQWVPNPNVEGWALKAHRIATDDAGDEILFIEKDRYFSTLRSFYFRGFKDLIDLKLAVPAKQTCLQSPGLVVFFGPPEHQPKINPTCRARCDYDPYL